MVSGFTSFGIHSGGPPISVYLLPQQLEKRQLMGTFAMFFTVVNLVKLVPYTWLGQFSTANLATSLALVPFAPVGVWLGYMALHRISQKMIYQISYAFLVAVGVKLSWEGVRGLCFQLCASLEEPKSPLRPTQRRANHLQRRQHSANEI